MEKLLSVCEVAAVLGFSEKTIYKYIAQKRLAAQRFCRVLRISPQELSRFIRANHDGKNEN